jgi:serine/threonine-protein kinase
LEGGTILAKRYEIIEAIGAGGMGEVYRARDCRLDRDVAIKIVKHSGLQNPELHERFDREIKSVAGLSHPNIVMLYDVSDHDEMKFAVMEFVEGNTLREWIGGGLNSRKIAEIGSDVAMGLAAAHQHSMMHRDIKPDNIIVAKDGRAKVLDFGLARPEVLAADQEITLGQVTPGTILYMSPEQAQSQELTCATDIFSLGTV